MKMNINNYNVWVYEDRVIIEKDYVDQPTLVAKKTPHGYVVEVIMPAMEPMDIVDFEHYTKELEQVVETAKLIETKIN